MCGEADAASEVWVKQSNLDCEEVEVEMEYDWAGMVC